MSPRKPSQQQPLPGNRGQQNNRHPLLLPTTSSAQPSDGGAPSPPLSWYASISAMSLSPSTLSGSTCLPSPPPSMQPAPASSGLSPTIIFSRTVLHESTPQVIDNSAISTRSSPPTAHPPARRAQSIPISFLVNPTPQSPRPFSFPDLWSPPPSPPPVSGISPSLSLASTSIQGEHPNRQYPSDHSLATTCFATTTETATTSLNDPSPSNDISGSPLSSTVNTLDIRRVNTNERAFTASFNQSSQIHQLLSSSSASTATHGASVIFDQRPAPSTTRSYIIDAQDTPNTGAPPVRQVSLRRTMNPDVKTTKTGKIQHRSKRIGTNRKSTAYNRFLLQRSRFYAKHFPDQTPQQRMKRISEEWAVSEKNPHTTRRRSRFSATEDQQELSSPSSGPSLLMRSEHSMSADKAMNSQPWSLSPDVETATNAPPSKSMSTPREIQGTHSTPTSPCAHQYKEIYFAGSYDRIKGQTQSESTLSSVTSSGSALSSYVEEEIYEGEEGIEDCGEDGFENDEE